MMPSSHTNLEVAKRLNKALPKYAYSILIISLFIHFAFTLPINLMLINVLSAVLAFTACRTWATAFANGVSSMLTVFMITLACRAAILFFTLQASSLAERKIAVLMVVGYLFYETLLVLLAMQNKKELFTEKVEV